MSSAWLNHGETTIWERGRLRAVLADIEIAGHSRGLHLALRVATAAANCIVVDGRERVLVLRRYRWITNHWGLELPGGRVDVWESPLEAAVREVREETGWEVNDAEPLIDTFPTCGLTDHHFYSFRARAATRSGPPIDLHEADELLWLTADEIRSSLLDGRVRDGFAYSALSRHMLEQV